MYKYFILPLCDYADIIWDCGPIPNTAHTKIFILKLYVLLLVLSREQATKNCMMSRDSVH